MAKRKTDLKKVTAFSISLKQKSILKALASHEDKNTSEVLRGIIPTADELNAFTSLKASGYGKVGKDITELIRETHKTYFAAIMGGSILFNIGLHSAAVHYFDKTGNDTFRLFSNWVKAVKGKKGYKFVTFFQAEGSDFKLLVSPGEKQKSVEKIIDRFMMNAPDAEQLNAIKMSATNSALGLIEKRLKSKTKVSRR